MKAKLAIRFELDMDIEEDTDIKRDFGKLLKEGKLILKATEASLTDEYGDDIADPDELLDDLNDTDDIIRILGEEA